MVLEASPSFASRRRRSSSSTVRSASAALSWTMDFSDAFLEAFRDSSDSAAAFTTAAFEAASSDWSPLTCTLSGSTSADCFSEAASLPATWESCFWRSSFFSELSFAASWDCSSLSCNCLRDSRSFCTSPVSASNFCRISAASATLRLASLNSSARRAEASSVALSCWAEISSIANLSATASSSFFWRDFRSFSHESRECNFSLSAEMRSLAASRSFSIMERSSIHLAFSRSLLRPFSVVNASFAVSRSD